jgi:uncharacterized protein with PIN domain
MPRSNKSRASWMTISDDREEWERLRPTQLRVYGVRTLAKHGANARPRCQTCKGVMRVMRREAHPVLGPQHELQTYTCAKCGKVEQVSTESPGAA